MTDMLMTKQKFINQWLRHFAPNLTKKQFEAHIKDQYIWHVFSFNLIAFDCLLSGDAARAAFNAVSKEDCICCDMFGSTGITKGLPFPCKIAEEIDSEFSEFYVMAKDCSWTYIKTHEGNMCGPYFLRIS